MPADCLAGFRGERSTYDPRGVRQKFDPTLVARRHTVNEPYPSRRFGRGEAKKAQVGRGCAFAECRALRQQRQPCAARDEPRERRD